MTSRRAIVITDSDDPRIQPYCNVRERDLVGRDGCFIAEGRVVLNVLAGQTQHRIESVLVLENRLSGISALLASLPDQVPVYCVRQEVMDRIAGFHLHRGILAAARRGPAANLGAFVASLGKDALVTALAGISNHDNMGSIFRNAAAFDADAVLTDDACCDPFYRKSIRVSVGAVLQVPHVRAGKAEEVLPALTEAGFELAALSPRGDLPVSALPKSGRRALLLGTEGQGLPDRVLRSVQTFRIPMSAGFDSLNVATASGIALYHASRFSI